MYFWYTPLFILLLRKVNFFRDKETNYNDGLETLFHIHSVWYSQQLWHKCYAKQKNWAVLIRHVSKEFSFEISTPLIRKSTPELRVLLHKLWRVYNSTLSNQFCLVILNTRITTFFMKARKEIRNIRIISPILFPLRLQQSQPRVTTLRITNYSCKCVKFRFI